MLRDASAFSDGICALCLTVCPKFSIAYRYKRLVGTMATVIKRQHCTELTDLLASTMANFTDMAILGSNHQPPKCVSPANFGEGVERC